MFLLVNKSLFYKITCTFIKDASPTSTLMKTNEKDI